MINTNLLPDLNQAQTMLKALAPSNGAFTFQTFADGSDKNKALIKQFNGSFEQHASQLTQLNQQGAGVFVTINQTDLQGRKAENITAIRALFVDFDNSRADRLNDLLSLDRLYDGALLPSFIVETSIGKHHAYWLADGISLGEFKPYQETLIYFFSGLFDGDNVDKAIHDLPRIMRLAGFYHNKGEPVLSKIVYPNGGQDIQRYSYEQIKAMIDSLPAPLAQASLLQTNSNTHTSKVILPQSPANSQTLPQLTAEKVRTLSRGRWETILGRLGYAVSTNPKEHTQCPVCGGKDRFKFDNVNQTGSYICSQGTGKEIAGDGLSLLIDHAGMTPQNAIASVTSVLNDMGLLSPYDGLDSPQGIEWGEPEPLEDTNTPATRYPIEAWPPMLQGVIKAVAYHAQVSEALAGQCVLGALSTIGQRYVNAPELGNKFMPASLFLITEAESGEGKSQATSLTHWAIDEWEKAAYTRYEIELAEWESDRDSQATPKDKNLFMATVPKPIAQTIMLKDATTESMIEAYVIDRQKNLSWTTDEAAQFLNGHSMKADTAGGALGTLTRLYDGTPIVRKRSRGGKAATDKTHAYDCRLTLDLQGQRVVLIEAITNPLLRGQGFLARFMFACPESMQGKRVWNSPERLNSDPQSDPQLQSYWQRCKVLLDPTPGTIQIDIITGQPIRFNTPFANYDAKKALADYRQAIENRLSDGEAFYHLKAFANRLAQNASRISTLWAFFDGREVVTADDIERASMLTEYSINEHLRYMHVKSNESPHSVQLLEWLIKRYKAAKTDRMAYSKVQANITICDLKGKANKANFELAIEVLADSGRIKIVETPRPGGGRAKREIVMNSNLL